MIQHDMRNQWLVHTWLLPMTSPRTLCTVPLYFIYLLGGEGKEVRGVPRWAADLGCEGKYNLSQYHARPAAEATGRRSQRGTKLELPRSTLAAWQQQAETGFMPLVPRAESSRQAQKPMAKPPLP